MTSREAARPEGDRPTNAWPVHHNAYPFYVFKGWHGMVASAWFPLLVRNHFAISPARIPRAIELSMYSIINSALKTIQDLVFARRIADAVLQEPPIFIVGHWRTGTTFLHELLTLDER